MKYDSLLAITNVMFKKKKGEESENRDVRINMAEELSHFVVGSCHFRDKEILRIY